MPFKIRCRLAAFMGDEEEYPCHFGYKIGDEFIYDGEQFHGRICLGLLPTMVPIVKMLHDVGKKGSERSLLRYAGHSKRNLSNAKDEQVKFVPVKKAPALGQMSAQDQGGWPIVCGDSRTSALFIAEPFDLASGGFDTPFHNREMEILEKIKNKPGMPMDMIMHQFSDEEREDIFPPLTPISLGLMLEELAQTEYIRIIEGKAYPHDNKYTDYWE